MKSKKILTILLSLAIMFTFMPAMAFAAAGDQTWSDGYASGTYDDGNGAVSYNAKRVWEPNGATDGSIVATLWTEETTSAVAQPVAGAATKKFYDLNNAYITIPSGTKKYATWTYSDFATGYDADTNTVSSTNYKLRLVQPDYTKEANDPADEADFVGAGRTFTVVVTAEGFTPDSYEDQTVTLHTEVYGNYTPRAEELYGNVPDQVITVQAKTADPDDLTAYVDGDKTKDDALKVGNTLSATYDGKAHTLVANEVPGYALKFAVQDTKTRLYKDVDTVEFKNATGSDPRALRVKITKWDTKNNTAVGDAKEFNIVVSAATPFTFKFDELSPRTTGSYAQVPADSEAKDFIIADGAFASDKEEAMSFFGEAYELTTTVNKSDSSLVTWTFTPVEKYDEVAEKYATLVGNYNYAKQDKIETKVQLVSSANDKDDDITFSGVTKKTYSAKKKTKKLAKTKSFQIAAVADSGNEITFTATTTNSKIKVSKAGKVTVKKGIKKGTYKVTVKAKTAAGNGYKAAKETKTYTIKIK